MSVLVNRLRFQCYCSNCSIDDGLMCANQLYVELEFISWLTLMHFTARNCTCYRQRNCERAGGVTLVCQQDQDSPVFKFDAEAPQCYYVRMLLSL